MSVEFSYQVNRSREDASKLELALELELESGIFRESQTLTCTGQEQVIDCWTDSCKRKTGFNVDSAQKRAFCPYSSPKHNVTAHVSII
jgi:hypothetical protein